MLLCATWNANKVNVAPVVSNVKFEAVRPITMETRCCNVFFPNYSKEISAEVTLVPPLWGKREKNVCFEDYLFTLLYAAELVLAR